MTLGTDLKNQTNQEADEVAKEKEAKNALQAQRTPTNLDAQTTILIIRQNALLQEKVAELLHS